MKRILVIILFLNLVSMVNGQNTFFKLYGGFYGHHIIESDTEILYISKAFESNIGYYTVNNHLADNGIILKQDTIGNGITLKDSLYQPRFFGPLIKPLTLEGKLVFPLIGYKNNANNINSDFFEYPIVRKVGIETNKSDTLYNLIFASNRIQNWNYVLRRYAPKSNSVFLDELFKFNEDTLIRLKNIVTTAGGYENIFGDNQSSYYTFLTQSKYSNNGEEYTNEIVKLDSTGRAIWVCRPHQSDSLNTGNFNMVQLPNGNLMCTWQDYSYKPYKDPNSNSQYAQTNSNRTTFFAEIDNTTGKSIWTKDIKQYLTWKMLPYVDRPNTTNSIDFKDVQLSKSGIIWVGDRTHYRGLNMGTKQLPVILKTDFNGNPVWYREYDLFPLNKGGDQGMTVSSFTQDKNGYLWLAGQYLDYGSDTNNFTTTQRAAILKLDSNGCLNEGCNATDNTYKPSKEALAISIYPNPNYGTFTIECLKQNCQATVDIFNMAGKLMYTNTLQHQGEIKVNSITWKGGTYLIRLTNNETKTVFLQQVIH